MYSVCENQTENTAVFLLENVSLSISLKVIKWYYIDGGYSECKRNNSNSPIVA